MSEERHGPIGTPSGLPYTPMSSDTALKANVVEVLTLMRERVPEEFRSCECSTWETFDARQLLSEFVHLARWYERAVVGEVGGPISWYSDDVPEGSTESDPTPFAPYFVEVEGPDAADNESGRALMALEYRRETGLDFAPREGTWLVAASPDTIFPASDDPYDGHTPPHLIGSAIAFAALGTNDEPNDTIAHMWTARAWRRRGVAAALVQEAVRRYPVKHLGYPLTEGGRAVIEKAAPYLLA